MAVTGAAFLASLSDEEAALLDPAQIRSVIEEKWRAGKSEFPMVDVSLEDFETALVSSSKAGASNLASLFGADLFLVIGALQGQRSALRALEEHYLSAMDRMLSRNAKRDVAQDVSSQVREALFVATAKRAPKLAQYGGVVPLAAWLTLVAKRALISHLRSKRDVGELPEQAKDVEGSTPEHQTLVRRYRDTVQRAVEATCVALPKAERDLLRWHLVEGLGIDALAPMLDVHRATVARMIQRAKSHLRQHTRERLRAELNLGNSSLDSLFASLRNEIEVSASRVLK